MEAIQNHLEHLINISPYPIAFMADRGRFINRWLVKSESMESIFHDDVTPLLNTDCELVMNHEKSFMDREKLLTSWQYYTTREIKEDGETCYGRNYMESVFENAGDRRVYALSVLYSNSEKDMIVNVSTAVQTPIRIWINGQIAYVSNYNYLFKNSFFSFKAKKGCNTVLVERLIFPGLDGFPLMFRNFMLNVRPCDQLRQFAEDPNYPFVDPTMSDRLKQSYRIVPDKAIYTKEETIGLVVLREYIESGVEDEIEVNLHNANGEKVATTRTKTGKKIAFELSTPVEGPLKITVSNRGSEEKRANNVYVLKGSFSEERDKLMGLAQEKLNNSESIADTVSELYELVDLENNRMAGTGEIVPENVWNNILEKYYDFTHSLRSLSDEEAKLDFSPSAVRRKITLFKKSGIDNGSIPYTVYLPANYSEKKRYPLVLTMFYGYGIGKFSPDPRCIREDNFSEAVMLNICGRGGLNWDYINEVTMFQIIQETIDRFSIDRDRIYMTGVCTGALKAFGMASRLPELFTGILSVTGTARLDIRNPDYSYLSNLSNLMVYQLSNVDDYAYNFTRVYDTANRFQQLKAWNFANFQHEEVEDYMNATPKMVNKLLEIKKEKYPKEVSYLTSEPIFNKSYWVTVERIIDLSIKGLIRGKVESRNRITVDIENISQFGLLIHKEAMELGNEVILSVNNQEYTVSLTDHTEIDVNLQANGTAEITARELDREKFMNLYDRIDPDLKRLGIREVYTDRCQIVKSTFDRSKKSFSLRLYRMLRTPLKERNRNYSYNVLKENENTSELLEDSNFVYFADMSDPSEIQREMIAKFGIQCDATALIHQGQQFNGDYFAVLKRSNPFNREKQALLMLANGKVGESALLDFMDTFDTNSLFYSDAVIYANGKYHSFRDKEQTPVVCG